MGRVNQIRVTGEVGSDLREQVGWKVVKRGLQWIDVTTQHCESHTHIAL